MGREIGERDREIEVCLGSIMMNKIDLDTYAKRYMPTLSRLKAFTSGRYT